ncbi:hypothetical protein JY98_03680 [Exiguobacterium mexicanum]|nr:hypothetical protein JY98_03680 [Exiguobacterium mexicanum]
MKQSLTIEETEKLRLDYETKADNLEDIVSRHYISRRCLHRYVKRHGWVRPTLEPRSTNHIEPRVIPFPSFYKAYFEDCLNTDELQKRFKCNHRDIKRTLDHHGIERMRRNERIKMKRQFEDSKGGR